MVARSAVLLAVVQIVAAAAASAIDLTGKWRVEYNASDVEFVDVVQSGVTVTTTLTPYPGFPLAMTGTFAEATRVLSLQVPGCTPPACYSDVHALVLPNGNWLNGRLMVGSPPLPGTLRSLASRCECFDGNLAGGDGCDARCRVEPCFDCTGMPSVCTPTPDGGACRDVSDCTSGETCNAGVCGGGVSVPTCIDLNGTWDIHGESTLLGMSEDWVDQIEQRDGVLRFVRVPGGETGSLGSIDSVTGAFDLPEPRIHALCPIGFVHTIGTAAADGLTFTATGIGVVPTPLQCQEWPFSLTGTLRRMCGNGELNSGEECDDGNTASGDGCAASCAIEPCWTCGDIPPSSCTLTFQSTCARPTRAAALRLKQSAAPGRDAIAARSGKTGPLAPATLGNPLDTTDYQVCLFDRSGPVPQLLFGASVPAGGTCGGQPCWRSTKGGFTYRNRAGAPHGIVKLQVAGGASDGRALVAGRGAGLNAPPLPLPVPLELQIQNAENGAGCFAIEIPANGVTRNDPATGRFVGHGAP